ncbi:2-amino-5-chloromuconic acid deaminase [Sphingobium sp. S6]|nr:2-amino-5-chloromuconic acid deaminase [Sphingobium sp. S8]CAD7338994.1 2-amino-5-chloromuconic acid deaminase [Sphingobium sp. S6]
MNTEQSSQSDPLCFMSARELANGYRAGRFTPEDVIQAHLSRIGTLEPQLHAYTEVFSEEAREAAARSGRRHIEGRALGPLDGVPVAIKDLIDVEGKICAAGSATLSGRIAPQTAELAERLLANGAILIGKTHTVEFAMGGWGTNAHLGSPRNPWFPDEPYIAGGSSSGSGVAVAARTATLAVGTDTGGSVRIPAAFNGIVGLMTTPGLISLEGVMPLSPSLDTAGPMGRTVLDVALLFDVLLEVPNPGRLQINDLNAGVGDLRLAAIAAAELEGVDAELVQAYRASLRHLQASGAEVSVIDLPRSLRDFQRQSEIMMAEAYALYGEVAEDPAMQMDPAVRSRVLAGDMPSRRYILARERSRQNAQEMLAALEGYDALLTPTTAMLPIPLAKVDETTSPSLFTRFVNQLGFCALALPNGLTAEGIPTSLQIVCRPHDEHLALRIGRVCEARDPMGGRLPAMC